MDNMLSLGYISTHNDPVTGGYPLGSGYRMYQPELMRFTAPDDWSPFGDSGLHPYIYCGNDPINHVDPTGHVGFLGIGLQILGTALMLIPGNAPEDMALEGTLAASSAARTAASAGEATTAVDMTGQAVAGPRSLPGKESIGLGEQGSETSTSRAIGGQVSASSTVSNPPVRQAPTRRAMNPADMYKQEIQAKNIIWNEEDHSLEIAATWHNTGRRTMEELDVMRRLGFRPASHASGSEWRLPYMSFSLNDGAAGPMKPIYEGTLEDLVRNRLNPVFTDADATDPHQLTAAWHGAWNQRFIAWTVNQGYAYIE